MDMNMATTTLASSASATASATMAMSTAEATCKISMLWNWYTIDSCFLSNTWHVRSRGMFAGTCIGVFFWVIAYCWYHRLIVEFDRNVAVFKQVKYDRELVGKAGVPVVENCCCDPEDEDEDERSDVKENFSDSNQKENQIKSDVIKPGSNFFGPLLTALSHRWFLPKQDPNIVYPSPVEHVARSGFYLIEWTVSYLLMLMWMYYNGYVIITMILGYFFGQLLFNYAPIAVMDRKELAEFPIRP